MGSVLEKWDAHPYPIFLGYRAVWYVVLVRDYYFALVNSGVKIVPNI